MATLRISYPGVRDTFVRFRPERIGKGKRRVSDAQAVRQAVERLRLEKERIKSLGGSVEIVPDQPLTPNLPPLPQRAQRSSTGSIAPVVEGLMALRW